MKLETQSPDAIVTVDETGRIVAFNEVAEAVFGYSAADVQGASLETLIPERFHATHRNHVERFSGDKAAARHMIGISGRTYGRRKNGEEFPTDSAISKTTVGGKLLLTVCLRDISDHERSDIEQRNLADTSEILMRAGFDAQRIQTDAADFILRSMADWCAVEFVHADGIRRVAITYPDSSGVGSRYQVCEHTQNNEWDSDHGVESPGPSETASLVNDPAIEVLESLACCPRHRELLRVLAPASLIIAPLIVDGHRVGALTFAKGSAARRYDTRDAREAGQLASRLALALNNAQLHAALGRSVQVRDEILGIVAHDLRSPLNAIAFRAHTMRRRGGGVERRDQSAVEGILRSTGTISRLIADLLDVSQLEAGKGLPITQEAIDTVGLLTEAIQCQLAATPASHREVRLDAAAALASTWGDRTRLLQVLDNLIANAMKFSSRHIVVGAGTKDGEELFWVTDDGPGVSAEDQPRLFDRFWQASKTDRRGAGLGLSIVHGIVSAHGGRIWVESEVGSGTTFFFTLPLHHPSQIQLAANKH